MTPIALITGASAGIGTERWQYENTGSHELYNSGHLYEAAVAHYQGTGSRALLDIAIELRRALPHQPLQCDLAFRPRPAQRRGCI